jgi:hypothetical protein
MEGKKEGRKEKKNENERKGNKIKAKKRKKRKDLNDFYLQGRKLKKQNPQYSFSS